MGKLKLTILGNGAAVPTSFSNPSSQLLTYEGKQFMFDCGEGTQMQMIKFKIRHRKLNHIFISHLHGDHFYGLIGLISTFHLYRREETLTIFAPAILKDLIRFQLEVSKTILNYELVFVDLEDVGDSALLDEDSFTINAFALKHSVPSWGFIFREKPRLRKINKDFVKEKSLKPEQIKSIKSGNDFIDSQGICYSNSMITSPSRCPVSYAYCSDTAYFEPIVKYVAGVNLLYHEATFDNAMESVANEKLHSTALQAAQIAKKSNVRKLMLGHFSARFHNPAILIQEAQTVFQNTILSVEGQTYHIGV